MMCVTVRARLPHGGSDLLPHPVVTLTSPPPDFQYVLDLHIAPHQFIHLLSACQLSDRLMMSVTVCEGPSEGL